MPLRGLGRVKKAMDNLENTLDKDLRGVYFAGLSAIIKETPVDSDSGNRKPETGNWMIKNQSLPHPDQIQLFRIMFNFA